MRSQRVYLTTQPQSFVFKNRDNRIFMVQNKSAADSIYVQFGDQPGQGDDAWLVAAGETFTLDPAAPADQIWVWASTTGIDNRMLLG